MGCIIHILILYFRTQFHFQQWDWILRSSSWRKGHADCIERAEKGNTYHASVSDLCRPMNQWLFHTQMKQQLGNLEGKTHKLMWQCCTCMLYTQLKDGFGFHCSYIINFLTSRKMYISAFHICNQRHVWFIILSFCKGDTYASTAGYCTSHLGFPPVEKQWILTREHTGSSWTLGHPAHYYYVQHLPLQVQFNVFYPVQ